MFLLLFLQKLGMTFYYFEVRSFRKYMNKREKNAVGGLRGVTLD